MQQPVLMTIILSALLHKTGTDPAMTPLGGTLARPTDLHGSWAGILIYNIFPTFMSSLLKLVLSKLISTEFTGGHHARGYS